MKTLLEQRDKVVKQLNDLPPIVVNGSLVFNHLSIISKEEHLRKKLAAIVDLMQDKCGKDCGHLCAMCGGKHEA